jgi:hypothetical protein
MRRIEDLGKLYQYTIDHYEDISKEHAIYVIRELIYLMEDVEDEITPRHMEQQLHEINEILQPEDKEDIDDLLGFELLEALDGDL